MIHWTTLRCKSSQTLTVARELADFGAWTPTWKRKRRLPRSHIRRVIEEPCIPSFVFVPSEAVANLPQPAYNYSFMRIDGAVVEIPDCQLNHLRKIAEKPTFTAPLPPDGSEVKFSAGPFQGLRGKVVSCTAKACRVIVEGFHNPIPTPPALLVTV